MTLVRRDDGTKSPVGTADIRTQVASALGAAQGALLEEAGGFLGSRTAEVDSVDEALVAAQSGFARLPMETLGDEGETRLNEAGVTVRCLLRPDGGLPDAGDPDDDLVAVVGRAY